MEAIIQLSQKHMNIGGRWKKWVKGVAGLVSHRRKRLCYVGRATSSIASRLETATHDLAGRLFRGWSPRVLAYS